ncbi:unnamed protein product [Lactuca saligna]|uniref:RNA polymerase II C-terminal domain phosphatase-like n=1 Tax=Lactuca saligna TaxID=75948 RepID=A0AA35YR42_LACSI|nr:unnamed protein product [Lactuca saligna]
MNLLVCFAFILDPRNKKQFLEIILDDHYELEGKAIVELKKIHIKNELKALYEDSCLSSTTSSTSTLRKRSNSNNPTSTTTNSNHGDRLRNRMKKSQTSSSSISELDKYLGESVENFDTNGSFEILLWWKVNSLRFLILSRMAKDLLAIPISTMVSESVNSSNIDDFAEVLDTELDSTSDTSPEQKEDANETYDHMDINRTKRQKIDDVLENVETSMKKDICTHPGTIVGMCFKCGEKMDKKTGVAFRYIHKVLRLTKDEITRLRERDLKNLFSQKKLCLDLDLDHTLLHSTQITDLTQEEGYLMNQSEHTQDALRESLFKLDSIQMLTKLRPFVHTFLKEASELFEMYIYTRGGRAYALEMVNLIDPKKVYFDSRVIALTDCPKTHHKTLDVVLVQETAILILDDTERVWGKKDKENLILMERYHFFASSCKELRCKGYKSLSELKLDESEVDGALARILQVLKRIHHMFFDLELGDNFTGRDVRQVMGTVRGEILKGLTHIISIDGEHERCHWATQQNKFLVQPRWLEAANYLWKRQPEEIFVVIVKEIKENT